MRQQGYMAERLQTELIQIVPKGVDHNFYEIPRACGAPVVHLELDHFSPYLWRILGSNHKKNGTV
jgi:hypothetical protein